MLLVLCFAISAKGQTNNNLEKLLPNCSKISIPENLEFSYDIDIQEDLNNKFPTLLDYVQLYCFAKQKNDRKLEAISLYKMAKFSVLKDKLSLEKVLFYLEKSIEISTDIGYWDGVLAAKEVQITVFTDNNLLTSAEYIANEFLGISQKNQDSIKIAQGFMLLGRIKREQEFFEDSEYYLLKSLTFSDGRSSQSKRDNAFTYLHLSFLYRKKGEYSLAKEYALKGLELSKEIPKHYTYLQAFFTYALVINNIDLGIYDNLDLLETVEIEKSDNYIKADLYYAYGLTYDKLGYTSKAIIAYQNCINYAIEAKIWPTFQIAHSKMIPLLESKSKLPNDVTQLLQNMDVLLQEKIFSDAQENAFRLNHTQLQNEKNKGKLLANQLENSRQINIYTTLLTVLFIILTLSIYIQFRTKNKLNKKITKLNQQLEFSIEELNERSNFISDTNQKLENLLRQRNKIIFRLKKFTSVLAHDFKEPLITISMFGKLITQKKDSKISRAKEQEFLGYIIDASDRLNNMVKRLYEYSSNTLKISEEFNTVDLNEVIQLICKDLQFKIKRLNAEISYSSLHSLNGDKILLYQLFQNLINNGLQYHKKGIPPKITIESKLEDGGIIVTVKDEGIGITKNSAIDIFNLGTRGHSQTASNKNGLGLGLATCKEIMQIHNGKIWYTSGVNKGTTFYLFYATELEQKLA